jgi:hypothetical protein
VFSDSTTASTNAYIGAIEYGHASNTLAFKTNATERMRIDSSGNVGIGTSSPVQKLHLNSTSVDVRLALTNSVSGSTNSDGCQFQYNNNDLYINNNESGFIQLLTGATPRMTIDGSGNVGIGTASPVAKLDVRGTAYIGTSLGIDISNPGDYHASANDLVMNGGMTLANTSQGSIFFADSATGTGEYVGQLNYYHSSDSMAFVTNNGERMRIDSSGNLLVGHSTSGMATPLSVAVTALAGIGDNAGATSTGLVRIHDIGTQNSRFCGLEIRNKNNGDIRIINVDVGTSNHADMAFVTDDGSSAPTERLRIQSSGQLVKYGDSGSARIFPQTDNAGYLGETDHRWQAVYAVNGTIQTSDEREKTAIKTSELGADFIRSLRPVSYKWKIGGYTSSWDNKNNETITPNPGVRTHYGFIAQEVKQACGSTDFGGWLQEDLKDPESMQSLRLHEFISPIVKALQEALDEIDTLKAEVAALKAG